MKEDKFKIDVLENRIIQISDKKAYRNYWSSELYNIYVDEKCDIESAFKFDAELEFENILNAKSIVLKEFKTKNFLII